MKNRELARLLAYVTGLVNQELLLQNEYLAAENRILRAQLPKRLRLTDPQRSTLAEIGKRLGRKAFCYLLVPTSRRRPVDHQLNVASASAVFSSITTSGPHEFFGHKRSTLRTLR